MAKFPTSQKWGWWLLSSRCKCFMLCRQITACETCLYYSPKERGRKEGKESIGAFECMVHDSGIIKSRPDLLHLWLHGIQQNVWLFWLWSSHIFILFLNSLLKTAAQAISSKGAKGWPSITVRKIIAWNGIYDKSCLQNKPFYLTINWFCKVLGICWDQSTTGIQVTGATMGFKCFIKEKKGSKQRV